MVGAEICGTAELVELTKAVEIAGEWPLMSAVSDACAYDFEGRVEEDDGGCVMIEEFTVGWLEEGASSECEDRGTLEARQGEVEVMVLDGSEAAFTAAGK